jgi:Galactose oxidase, central domain
MKSKILSSALAAVLAASAAWGEDTFTPTGSMPETHDAHTATLLPNGRVLVAGGSFGDDSVLASATLYNPVSGSWNSMGSMAAGRYWHTATLLPNGKVLVAGGSLASAELYGPAGSSTPTPPAVAPVTVTIAGKKKVGKATSQTYKIKGTTSANATEVRVAVGKGKAGKKVKKKAKLIGTKWKYTVRNLQPGTTTPIKVKAFTADARVSAEAKIKIKRQ